MRLGRRGLLEGFVHFWFLDPRPTQVGCMGSGASELGHGGAWGQAFVSIALRGPPSRAQDLQLTTALANSKGNWQDDARRAFLLKLSKIPQIYTGAWIQKRSDIGA